MTYENLLNTAGFNDVEQSRLISLSYRFPEMKEYAKSFMSGDRAYASFETEVKKIDAHVTPEASVYALHMVFLCHAFAMLEEVYAENDIPHEMFENTAKDLMYKTRECILRYGDIGTVSVYWYWEFLALHRFAFGRLQFGCLRKFENGHYEKNGYTIDDGDLVLDCHIPSGGPLTQEMCFDSYRRVWAFWHHLFPDGVVRIQCGTHLFYPGYRSVIGANTKAFADNFDIISVTEKEEFGDAWRFLDTNDIADPSKLPTVTSLQRRFIEYIKNGGKYGSARGVLLFDGDKIVNK